MYNKKPMLVMPFWNQTEIDQLCWMIERWDLFTNKSDYEFLLAGRFDHTGDTTKLRAACEKHAVTSEIRLEGTVKGYPGGCTDMWVSGMHYLADRDDISFAFWLEADVVPQYTDWLDYLSNRWNDDLYLMGHLVDMAWLELNIPGPRNIRKAWQALGRTTWGIHPNGAACYNCKKMSDLITKYNISRHAPWDVLILSYIEKENGRPFNTVLMEHPPQLVDVFDMFEFRLGKSNVIRQNKKAKLVHGAKTTKSKQIILDNILSLTN